MARYADLSVEASGLNTTLAGLVAGLLEKGVASAVLAPARHPYGATVRQTLITDPAQAETVDPLAPVVPVNAATQLGKLTRKQSSMKVAAFLRSCEVRAFLELAKLKQASLENVLLIGMDCLGRYETTAHAAISAGDAEATEKLLKAAAGKPCFDETKGHDVVRACKACDQPVADNVDLRLLVIGMDPEKGLALEALTEAGEAALDALGLPELKETNGRDAAVEAVVAARTDFKETLRTDYREQVSTVEGLMGVISNCINCYNCRGVCPVCYCRECVFGTDTFAHESRQYFGWAQKRGSLRMPTDTLFFHLTRMAHMSTLCVNCGQCSSVCPNDVSVSELFSMVGDGTQAVFDYVPGRDPEEAQPLAAFFDDELPQVTGQVK